MSTDTKTATKQPRFSSTEQDVPLLRLPKETLGIIASYMTVYDRILLRASCKAYFQVIADLHPFRQVACNQFKCLEYFASQGYTSCIEYCRTALNFFVHSELCSVAAKHHQLATLKYLYEECHCAFFGQVLIDAVGNVEVLEYTYNILNKFNASSTNAQMVKDAAGAGNVDSLKFLIKNGFPWSDYTTYEAAAKNHVDVLQYAMDNSLVMHLSLCTNMDTLARFAHRCSDIPDGIKYAAMHGDFPRMKFWMDLYQYGPQKELAIWAAKGGNIDCLKYAVEHGKANTAAKYYEIGSVECFQYLAETIKDNVIFVANSIYANAIHKRQRDVIEYAIKLRLKMPDRLGLRAAETGDLEFFKWAVEDKQFDCSFFADGGYGSESEENNEDIYIVAINSGSIDILKYCFEKNLPRHFSVAELINAALDMAHLNEHHFKFVEFLSSLEEVDFPGQINCATNCSIETLKFLIKKGVSVDVKYALNCASADCFENFAFMVKHLGPVVPITEALCYRLDMAKYAYEHNCPLGNGNLQYVALARDSVDLLRFLVFIKQVTLDQELLKKAEKTMFILPYLKRIMK